MLSELLKQRRLELGLSLSQVAQRAHTSPATLHRYENGWCRFEVYTLQKLASALGCRLTIAIEPVRNQSGSLSPKDALNRLGRLFWEKRLEGKDLRQYPSWVIKQVLELGTIADVRSLVRVFGRKSFLDQVATLRFASEKTERFWRMILDREGVKCTATSSPKAAGISWLK